VFYEDGKKEYVDIYVYKKDIKNEPHIYIATGDWRVFLLNRWNYFRHGDFMLHAFLI